MAESTLFTTETPKPEFTGDESWYLWIGCITTNLLMPLFVVLMGIICQALIAFFITMPIEIKSRMKNVEMGHVAGSSTRASGIQADIQTEVESHCGCCKSCKESVCGSRYAKCMMVWQILSMIVILVLDLVSFFQWKESDYIDDEYDSTTWNNYQCFSARVVISSNYSLVVLNFVAIIINPDWKDGFRIAWNIANGILFFCYIIWLLMYGLVGAITYCWITICIVGPAVAVWWCCKSFQKELPLCHQCCIQVISPIFLMFFVGILALSMINLFEGMGYWDSFQTVLFEREWDTYYGNIDAEAVFRGFTAFLG